MDLMEIDRISRNAVRDVLQELCPILGIRYIVLTDKQMKVGFNDEVYSIKNPAAYSPRAFGKCVADIMMHGKCDMDYTVKQIRRKK